MVEALLGNVSIETTFGNAPMSVKDYVKSQLSQQRNLHFDRNLSVSEMCAGVPPAFIAAVESSTRGWRCAASRKAV